MAHVQLAVLKTCNMKFMISAKQFMYIRIIKTNLLALEITKSLSKVWRQEKQTVFHLCILEKVQSHWKFLEKQFWKPETSCRKTQNNSVHSTVLMQVKYQVTSQVSQVSQVSQTCSKSLSSASIKVPQVQLKSLKCSYSLSSHSSHLKLFV